MSRPDWFVQRRTDPWAIVSRADVVGVTKAAGPTATAVWVLLATYANRDGERAFPMQRTVSIELGISKRTVERAVHRLVGSGWMSARWEPYGSGRRRVYELHFRGALPPKEH